MSSQSISSESVFDLDGLVHLEQTFFDTGYTDGYTHGRTHGLIEGRALGQEKGYELWEEVGFYEGFGKVWEGVCRRTKEENTSDSRAESHVRHLLDLISKFPRVNPSTHSQTGGPNHQLDVLALLSKIRARYKALCATLGVKPRLHTATPGAAVKEGIRNAPSIQKGNQVWQLDYEEQQLDKKEMSF